MKFLLILQVLFLHFAPGDLDILRSRKTAGAYTSVTGAKPVVPADYQRIRQFADQAVAAPVSPGRGPSESIMEFAGYRGDSLVGQTNDYAIWAGHKPSCAAFIWQMERDPKYADAAIRHLMGQIRVGGSSNMANWPNPVSTSTEPVWHRGANESVIALHWLYCYDLVKDRMNQAQKDSAAAWFVGQAWYTANRAHNYLKISLPGRLQNNWGLRAYVLNPNGVTNAGWADPIYEADGHNTYEDAPLVGSSGRRKITHRNADGSLGNSIARSAEERTNTFGLKMGFVGLTGIEFGDTALVWHAKCYFREFLAFSVFPDFTNVEYYRASSSGGIYGSTKIHQGLNYSAMQTENFLSLAYALALRGDSSLFTFKTRDGAHGTQCQAGQPDKNLYGLLRRQAWNATGFKPLYYDTVSPKTQITRLDEFDENPANTSTDKYGVWNQMLHWADRYYSSGRPSDTLFRSVANRTFPGARPYQNSNTVAAGQMWNPYSGTTGAYPGMNFMFSRLPGAVFQPAPYYAPAVVSQDTSVVYGPLNVVLPVRYTASTSLTSVFSSQVSGTGPIKVEAASQPYIVVASKNYLQPIPVGTYTIRMAVKDSRNGYAERVVRLTIAP